MLEQASRRSLSSGAGGASSDGARVGYPPTIARWISGLRPQPVLLTNLLRQKTKTFLNQSLPHAFPDGFSSVFDMDLTLSLPSGRLRLRYPPFNFPTRLNHFSTSATIGQETRWAKARTRAKELPLEPDEQVCFAAQLLHLNFVHCNSDMLPYGYSFDSVMKVTPKP